MKKLLSLGLSCLLMLSLLCVLPAFAADIPFDSSWKITDDSHMGDKVAAKAFDGNGASYWHSGYVAEGSEITSRDELPLTITVDFGKTLNVSGWRYTARTDNPTGTFQKYNIYASNDGAVFKKIFEGTFNVNTQNPTAEASWGGVSMRAIKIEVTEAVAGFATAAEIVFLTGTNGTAIQSGATYEASSKSASSAGNTSQSAASQSGSVLQKSASWKITDTSHMGDKVAANAFDGRTDTYWHTGYVAEGSTITSRDELPQSILVDFGGAVSLTGFRYTARTDNATGIFKKYVLYSSTDGTTFTKFFEGALSVDTQNPTAEVGFGKTVTMRAIKIEVTEANSGFGTAAEIAFLTGAAQQTQQTSAQTQQTSAQTSTAGAASAGKASTGIPYVSHQGWTISASSQFANSAPRAIDNNPGTFWHSNYTVEGASTITSHDNPPFTLEFTLPSLTKVSGFTMLPRAEKTGVILGADIYVSDSENGEYTLLKGGLSYDNTTDPREVPLTANIAVRRIKLVITEGMLGYGTLAEFYAWSEDSNKETVSIADYAAHDEENRLYKLDTARINATYDGENWAGNSPIKVIDGLQSSYWQTEALTGGYPATLHIDFGQVLGLTEIHYTPRQSSDMHGLWLQMSLYGSADGEDWVQLFDALTLERDLTTKTFVLPENTEVRYLDFDIEASVANRVSCAEIEFYQTKEAYDKVTLNESETYVLTIGSKDIAWEKGEERGTTTLDVAPYITNGSTLIPLRGLVEQMGGVIGWDGAKETVTIEKDGRTITLQIFNQLVHVSDPKLGNLTYTLLNFPVITDSRTFIPVRFVTEQLGYTVLWDGDAQTVTITK